MDENAEMKDYLIILAIVIALVVFGIDAMLPGLFKRLIRRRKKGADRS